ncbi:alpha/beta-hydrolase [Pleomassaria siparia CBS 279.74]|uniref:Alpha/beta-hydrolase n=1 Tax=Pleomassaria siparia CBS 279.74 TaxID=1314801 RepID=A0A6G1KGD8_9PLEO|nr:alpha/beta-hydrolase [Pleomassaria siparia CBS 279.74]
MVSTAAAQIQDERFSALGLSKMIVNDAQVCCYSRSLGAASATNPILVLLHGYPQSSYTWRHLIPLLPANAPIFAPDLAGYGNSAPIKANDKLSVGNALLSALKTEVRRTSSGSSSDAIPAVLIGHDRGARVAHRLAVSGADGIDILGVCLIDIVPTITQWAASSRASEVVGYFHWPFLANVELATKILTAYGGGNWCRDMTLRWAGKNSTGLSYLKADNSLDVYAGFFEQPHTIWSSNEDYRAGATEDIQLQEEDQKVGKKIKAPLLLLYSEGYLGSRYDVPKEWKDWVAEGVKLDSHAVGNDIGHFGAEEAPQESAQAIKEWLKRLGLET